MVYASKFLKFVFNDSNLLVFSSTYATDGHMQAALTICNPLQVWIASARPIDCVPCFCRDPHFRNHCLLVTGLWLERDVNRKRRTALQGGFTLQSGFALLLCIHFDSYLGGPHALPVSSALTSSSVGRKPCQSATGWPKWFVHDERTVNFPDCQAVFCVAKEIEANGFDFLVGIFTELNREAWASEGGGGSKGNQAPLDFENFSKKGCFSVSSGKKQFYHFWPPPPRKSFWRMLKCPPPGINPSDAHAARSWWSRLLSFQMRNHSCSPVVRPAHAELTTGARVGFHRKLQQWWQRRRMKKNDAAKERQPWQNDYENLVDFPGLFDEYLEMGWFWNFFAAVSSLFFAKNLTTRKNMFSGDA